MSLKELLDISALPSHVAFIMDGNGRWAKERGLERFYGHREGVNTVRKITEAAGQIGIKYLTLYTFSTENWNRPRKEINELMSLLAMQIEKETPELIKNDIRLHIIGNWELLPAKVSECLKKSMEETASCSALNLILALSYSSRWEITHAARLIAEKVRKDEIIPEQISEELFASCLSTSAFPDPDILIRTGGEKRVSNYLLWQISYSELFFVDKYWPDFGEEDLYKVLSDYQNRERRFGKTSEQL